MREIASTLSLSCVHLCRPFAAAVMLACRPKPQRDGTSNSHNTIMRSRRVRVYELDLMYFAPGTSDFRLKSFCARDSSHLYIMINYRVGNCCENSMFMWVSRVQLQQTNTYLSVHDITKILCLLTGRNKLIAMLYFVTSIIQYNSNAKHIHLQSAQIILDTLKKKKKRFSFWRNSTHCLWHIIIHIILAKFT